MSIKKFIEELAEALEVRNEGLRVVPTEMQKNNGIVQNGLSFYRKEEKVAPIFWLNKFYERFKMGELSKEGILERVIKEYESLPTPNIPDMEEWMSSPEFLSQISIHLVNGPRNRRMIEDRKLVCYEVENTDLACLFYAKVFLEEDTLGEVAITERIMEEYLPNVRDAQELYHLITEQIQPEELRLESSLAVMERLLREKRIDVPPFPTVEDYMYILSNRQMTFGAGSILAKVVRKVLLEKFPSGRITVLPSLVHELILLDSATCGDLKKLRDTVRQVNASEVSQEDFLADEVYQYDANTGKLAMVDYTEDESEDPSSFSLKTIDILRNMRKADAELFVKFCKYSVCQPNGQLFLPNYDEYLECNDIKYTDVMRLSEMGLIFSDGTITLNYTLSLKPNVIFINRDLYMKVSAKELNNTKLFIKHFPFTDAGTELASLVSEQTSDESFIEFGKAVAKNSKFNIGVFKLNLHSGFGGEHEVNLIEQ